MQALDARVSGGKKGFHVLKLSNDGRWAEEVSGYPRWRLINEIRARNGLTGNILFDAKSYRNVTRVAGEWQLMLGEMVMEHETIAENKDDGLARRILLTLYLADRRGYGLCLVHLSKNLVYGEVTKEALWRELQTMYQNAGEKGKNITILPTPHAAMLTRTEG